MDRERWKDDLGQGQRSVRLESTGVLRGGRRSWGGVGWSPVAEFPRREHHTVVSSPSSAPWAGCSPPPQCPGCKRKRSVAFRAEVEGNTATEAQDTWVVESLSGLKMKLMRQRVSSVLPEHHEVFKWMLGKDPLPRPATSNPILEKQTNQNFP